MKLKWLLLGLLSLFILNSCKKDNNMGQHVGTVITPASSQFSVNNVLQSNMVVQRDKPLKVWGTATASTGITVTASWSSSSFKATTDASGNWTVTIPATAANATPQTISIKSSANSVLLSNILIGDVWICSGQSNMVYQVDSIPPFRGVTDYHDEIAAADFPEIRALTINTDIKSAPVDSLSTPGKWTAFSPQTIGNISAVAYFFARKIYQTMNVPVGIIVSAVNGTSCEGWINKQGFQANPSLSAYAAKSTATQYYNGMISPLTNLAIKGFTWYQGENNKNNYPPSDYTKLNITLIEAWRNVFKQGSLPFYLVQMTPFDQFYNSTTPPGGDLSSDDYAKFREAQANVLTEVNTGMAVTMDVGEVTNQHPKNKKPVGERLALLALKNTYGQNIACYGPHYASYSLNGSTAIINFATGTAEGLNTIKNTPINQFFYVAGADHAFMQATATISGNQIILTAPATVMLPIQAIRYAFTVAPVTNLQNDASLPMEPFRTDNWDN